MRMRRRTLVVVLSALVLMSVYALLLASAEVPIVVTTRAASDVGVFNGATLNGNLADLGTIGVPPVRVAGPVVTVGPGFNTVAIIDTTGSNFLLIIVGGCGGYDGTLNSVSSSPVNTISKLPFSGILVPGNEGNVSDAFFVTNPVQSSTTVTAAWSAGSCSYGSKYVALYTFSGVDVVGAPMVNNGNMTANNFNGFSPPFTTSFTNPASHQLAIFTEVVTDDAQNFKDIHLVNMTGLTSTWTYGSTANCAGAAWCPSGGIGFSRTAVTFTANNIDLGATSWFINGTFTPRTSVDVYFQWGDTVTLGNETVHVTKTVPQDFAASLKGLKVKATYYFRACASSPVTCGSTLSFTTGEDVLFDYLTVVFFFVLISGIVSFAAFVKIRRDGSLR